MKAVDATSKLLATQWVAESLAKQFDKANAAIFAVDLNEALTEWNLKAAEITGLTRSSALGRCLTECVDESCHADLQDALQASFRAEVREPILLHLSCLTGLHDAVQLIVGLSPQFDIAGDIVGTLFVGQILPPSPSAQQLQQQQRWQQSKQAETSFASLAEPSPNQRVVGMINHQFVSPLNGIIDLARTFSRDDPPLKEPMTTICSSAERAVEVVTKLRDYVALVGELDGVCALDTIDVGSLLTECCTHCMKVNDQCCNSESQDALPLIKDVSERLSRIVGDSQFFSRMVYHLVTQAFKFTPESHQGNTNRIFEVFQQYMSQSGGYEGIGFGVATAWEVARICSERVGSKPSIVSKFSACSPSQPMKSEYEPAPPGVETPPVASTPLLCTSRAVPRDDPASWLGPARPMSALPAHLSLEAAAAADAEAEAEAAQARQPRVRPTISIPEGVQATAYAMSPMMLNGWRRSKQNRLIMSVGSDRVNQEVMQSALEPAGFEIAICMTGSECLAHMDNKVDGIFGMPCLVLLDLVMLGSDGLDLVTALRKVYTEEQLPIIIVSIKNQTSWVMKGLELGCNDWIHKPFDEQGLIACVSRQLISPENHRPELRATRTAAPAVPPASLQARPHHYRISPRSACASPCAKDPIQITVVFVTLWMLDSVDVPEAHLFEALEATSLKHNMSYTKVVGSCYLAAECSTEGGMCTVDNALLLAISIEDAIRNVQDELAQALGFCIGIDSDGHSHGNDPLQGQATYLQCNAAKGAKLLSECTHTGTIFISGRARNRVSTNVDSNLMNLGFHWVTCLASSSTAAPCSEEFFSLKRLDDQKVQDSRFRPRNMGHHPTFPMVFANEWQTQSLSSLISDSSNCAATCPNIQHESPRVCETQPPMISMENQLHQKALHEAAASLHASRERIMVGSQDAINGSVIFLQWQNAQLEADVCYYQQRLIDVKAEAQTQASKAQALQRQQHLLTERIEHLELDLCMRAACRAGCNFADPTLGVDSGFGMPFQMEVSSTQTPWLNSANFHCDSAPFLPFTFPH